MSYGLKDLSYNLVGARQDFRKLRKDEFWALSDVSLELKRGEFIGIIGSNGSGKTTLLRLIHGIFPPDMGDVTVRGKIGALIALGAGFHPHFTGRENIFLNGTILGMDREYIGSQLDRIVEFAEIGDFLEAPVTTYSSGMRVRLGFAIAAHMNPDILLVDEVLSVGDSSFRERCYNYMTEYKQNGGTVVFISHNTLAVEQVCDRVIWLEKGVIKEQGNSSTVVESYEQSMLETSRKAEVRLFEEDIRSDEGIDVGDVWFTNDNGDTIDAVPFGEPFTVNIAYRSLQAIDRSYFGVELRKGFSKSVPASTKMSMLWDGLETGRLPNKGVVTCRVARPNLAPGAYSLFVLIQRSVSGKFGGKFWVRPYLAGSITIQPGSIRKHLKGVPANIVVGQMPPLFLEHEWTLDGEALSVEQRGDDVSSIEEESD